MARKQRQREERGNSYPGCWYYLTEDKNTGKEIKTYYCSFKVDGKVQEYKFGTASRGKTLAKCNIWRAKLMEGGAKTPQQKRTEDKLAASTKLSKVFESYGQAEVAEKYRIHGVKVHADQKMYKTDKSRMAKHVLPFFKDVDINSISAGRIKSFRKNLEGKGLAAQTVKHSLAFLRRLFRYSGIVWTVDLPQVKNEVTEDLTPLELKRYQKVLIEDGSQIADMILLIANTGCRPVDVRRLTWDNISFQRKTIQLEGMKGGVDTAIPMNRAAERIFRKQPKDSEYIFSFKGEMMPKYHYQKFSKKLAVKACLPEGHRPSYCLRHWYATELYERTHDVKLVSEMLGHRSLDMTMRYAKARDERQVEAAGIMELAVGGE